MTRKVRIWSLAKPGSLVASLFDANGLPIGEYDMVEPVEIVGSPVPPTRRGEFPEGPMLRYDRAIGREIATINVIVLDDL